MYLYLYGDPAQKSCKNVVQYFCIFYFFIFKPQYIVVFGVKNGKKRLKTTICCV